MISFISTADCNIDCPACSQNIVRVTKVQHRPETMTSVLAKAPYLSQLIWHGGEPYLIKRFREFIDNFNLHDNPNLAFGFTSNGTMITEQEAAKLKKFPRINASVSIDSFNPDTFQKIWAGASFDRVWQNVERLMGMHNAPRRVFSVGMIVCKSNFRELADNLQFAIDHDVGLNLSPVLLYPVTEQLNCFSDFESETAGWVETLDKAAAIAARAKAARRLAVGRVDPSGTIEELGLIFEQARAEYSVVAELECEIKDPHASLARMRRPALIAYDAGGVPRAYARLGAGVRTCVLKFPRCHIGEQPAVHINLVHDFLEPIGFLTTSVVPIGRSAARVNVPQFAGSTRPRNIHWANFGTSTPDGSNILDPKDIDSIYHKLYQDELSPPAATNLRSRVSDLLALGGAAFRGAVRKHHSR